MNNKLIENSSNPQIFSLKKVFRGASIYSIGDVLVKSSGFFLIPIYTRVLTPADFGIVGYLQVYLRIATVILAFGFTGAQTRYYYENSTNPESLGRFSFTINLVPICFAALIGIPLTVFSIINQWTIGNENIPFYPFMVLTLWTVVLQVFANNAVSWFQARQKFMIASILQFTRFASITGFTLLFIIGFDLGALGRVGGLFAGMAFFVIISFTFYARNFIWKPSRDALKYAVAFGAPVVIHMLAGTIHNAVDRIILERYVSLDDLGIYSLAFTIGNTLNTFIMAFNRAYQPSFFQLMSSGEENSKQKVIKAFKAWLVLVSSIAAIGIVLGGPFLRIFAGPDFQATIEIFPWIIVAVYMGGFYYFFSSPIFYYKKTKYLPMITCTSVIVNICLNLLFIPMFGIIGAAIATLISHVVQSGLAFFIGNKLYKVNWPLGWIFLSICSITVLMSLLILF